MKPLVLPIFEQKKIVTSVDEKQRMDKVCDYEEKHGVEIFKIRMDIKKGTIYFVNLCGC